MKYNENIVATSLVKDNYNPYLKRIFAYYASQGTSTQVQGIANDAERITDNYRETLLI